MLTKCRRASSSHVQILTCFLVTEADSMREWPRPTQVLIFPTFSKTALEGLDS